MKYPTLILTTLYLLLPLISWGNEITLRCMDETNDVMLIDFNRNDGSCRMEIQRFRGECSLREKNNLFIVRSQFGGNNFVEINIGKTGKEWTGYFDKTTRKWTGHFSLGGNIRRGSGECLIVSNRIDDEDFMKGFMSSCVSLQFATETKRDLSEKLITRYCRCMGNYASEVLSDETMVAIARGKLDINKVTPFMQIAETFCTHRVLEN